MTSSEMDEGRAGTSALDAALERRDRMAAALDALEALLAQANAAPQEFAAAVTQMRGLVVDHVSAADDPEQGLLQEVVARAPRLATAARRLQEEHPELVALADQAAASAEGLHDPGLPELWSFAHAEATQLLGQLREHRRKGARLLSDAYDIDLGGGD